MPLVTCSRPATQRPSVVLPEPDSPTRPTASPRPTASDTPRRAATVPPLLTRNVLCTSSTVAIGCSTTSMRAGLTVTSPITAP